MASGMPLSAQICAHMRCWSTVKPCPNLHDTSITVPASVRCVPLGCCIAGIPWARAVPAEPRPSPAATAVMETMRLSIRPSSSVIRGDERAQPLDQRPRRSGALVALPRQGLQEGELEPVLGITPRALREVGRELLPPLERKLPVQVVPQLRDHIAARHHRFASCWLAANPGPQ